MRTAAHVRTVTGSLLGTWLVINYLGPVTIRLATYYLSLLG